MAEIITIERFLELADAALPIVDVRSPKEYLHAHIPGAVNIPLFDDEQRSAIGTLYTHQGKVQAVQKGLEFVGPKLRPFTKEALRLKSPQLLVHCWRGGMRSAAMAWLFETVNLKCYLLQGGYKAYRNYVLSSFERPYRFILLGGCTGSGKTDILRQLSNLGEQVLDLEYLANHKGSAFGAIGEEPQPSSEYFEHLVFNALSKMDISRRIWVEDESRNVGKVFIPQSIWDNMSYSEFVKIDTDYNVRLERILRDYAKYEPQQLTPSILKIEKRLGYDKCKKAYDACINGDMKEAATIILAYYDKLYNGGLEIKLKGKEYRTLKVNSLNITSVCKNLINI